MGLTGEKKREYQRKWQLARRAAWFEGKVCRKCGSTENLEANHMDRTTKRFNPAALWGMSDQNPDKIEELAKLEVLCHDCHIGLAVPLPVHGIRYTYVERKCRCAECRSWYSEMVRRKRARAKARREGAPSNGA